MAKMKKSFKSAPLRFLSKFSKHKILGETPVSDVLSNWTIHLWKKQQGAFSMHLSALGKILFCEPGRWKSQFLGECKQHRWKEPRDKGGAVCFVIPEFQNFNPVLLFLLHFSCSVKANLPISLQEISCHHILWGRGHLKAELKNLNNLWIISLFAFLVIRFRFCHASVPMNYFGF